jgi:hypothetical protein
MPLTARLTTLLILALAACAPAAAQERSSTLKLVAKSNSALQAQADDEAAAEAPILTPPAPEVPKLGAEILSEPLPPNARRAAVLSHGQTVVPHGQIGPRSQAPYGAHHEAIEPDFDHAPPGHGEPQYEQQSGSRLHQHAERLRNYIDNRPRQLPLQSESWLNKPLGVSYFAGGMWLDDPLHGVVGGNAGFMYGGRFSWDFNPSFGVETRLGGANVGIVDRINGTDLAPAGIFYADIDWLWYFTGDTRWRPFALIGTGFFDIDYTDAQPVRHHSTVLQLPIGFGVKYRHSSRIAIRVDLIDNIGFASGPQDTMHNWSLTAGLEARFGGGRKRSYWPWNPSREWW